MLSPQAGISAPTLTVMQGFEAKKKCFVHFLPSSCILHHTVTTQPRIEPRCGELAGEHVNHYTAQFATMQWQNVVFKPNVWEKGNGSCVSVCIRVSNRTWTRTVNPNEPFHFGEPEPNLNQQNFTSVNLNQTWTLKIVLKWTRTEPEPLTKVRIYFSISGCHWRWYTHNKSSGDHQQDQQFVLFFFWTKRVTTVEF